MTNLDALKSSVNYPLDDNPVIYRLTKRGLNPDAENTTEVANSKEFQLAYADTLVYVITMVNLSQGGSITQPSVAATTSIANNIYRKYGEPEISASGVSPVVRRLNR